jgi:hypothetical protein
MRLLPQQTNGLKHGLTANAVFWVRLICFALPIRRTCSRRTSAGLPLPPKPLYRPVTVPSGFVTDFASIPRAFWSALRPDGDYAYAAIIHDYLYWTQPVTRETADEILRFAMQDLFVESTTVTVIHRAVRLGGGRAWDDNARLKGMGEKRVLKRLPETPTVRWTDWKKMPDVFL